MQMTNDAIVARHNEIRLGRVDRVLNRIIRRRRPIFEGTTWRPHPMDRMTRWRDGVNYEACFSKRYRQLADVGPEQTMCKQDTWCHFPACQSTAALCPNYGSRTARPKDVR